MTPKDTDNDAYTDEGGRWLGLVNADCNRRLHPARFGRWSGFGLIRWGRSGFDLAKARSSPVSNS